MYVQQTNLSETDNKLLFGKLREFFENIFLKSLPLILVSQAAVTNCHKYEQLKKNFFSSQSSVQKFKIWCLKSWVLLEKSERESILSLSPSSSWMPSILGIPQLLMACLQPLPLSSHDTLLMCLCPNFLLVIRTPIIGFRDYFKPVRPNCSLIYICQDPGFKLDHHIHRDQGLGLKHIFLGGIVESTTLLL